MSLYSVLHYMHTFYIFVALSLSPLSISIYLSLSLSLYIYIYMYVCMYVCMYACMHACMYACVYVCMCISVVLPHTYIHACSMYSNSLRKSKSSVNNHKTNIKRL